ncbi:MAG: hypothetical protein ACK5JD_14435 [Mangrovibacterium sp.]
MTGEEKLLLEDFKAKLRLLMKRHSVLKADRDELKAKAAGLDQKLTYFKSENRELVKKYDDLKVAKVLSVGDDEQKQVKQRINKIVREIDKCIAQLNV